MRQYFNIGQPGGCGEQKCSSCYYASEQTHDALHTYSLLASSAARYREVERARLDEKDHLPEHYKGKALALLRERIPRYQNSGEKWKIMLDVLRLYVCEWYLRDEEAARVHLAFFAHLWNSLDIDHSTFDLHVHNVISLNDIILAAHMGRPPVLPLHPAANEIPLAIRNLFPQDPNSDKSSGLRSLCKLASLDRSLKSIISDLVDFSNLMDTSLSIPTSLQQHWPNPSTICPLCAASYRTRAKSAEMENGLSNCQNRQYLSYDVVGYSPLSRMIPTNLSLPGQSRRRLRVKLISCLHRLLCCSDLSHVLEQALRWTLYICTALVAALHPRRPGKYDMSVLAQRLQTWLLKHQLPTDGVVDTSFGTHNVYKFRFWMCVTGVRTANTGTEIYDWFLKQAVDIAKSLHFVTVGQVESALGEYMFVQCAHADAVQALAYEMDLEMSKAREITIFDRIAIVSDRQRKPFCVHDF